jgi:hypothetical protein
MKKIKVGLCDLHDVCVPHPLQSTFEQLKKLKKTGIHIIVTNPHLSGALHESPPLVFVFICVSTYRC